MKRINYNFSRALAMLLCATLLIMNLEMTAFAAAGVTDDDSSGIVVEETIMDTNLLPPDAEDQTGKEEFQQEEGSLPESTVGGTDGSSRSETANDGKNDITETVEITAWDELQPALLLQWTAAVLPAVMMAYSLQRTASSL